MTADLVPLRTQQTTDVSRMENFLVPNRPLSRDEQQVYRTLGYNYARLHALDQERAYALLLTARGQQLMQTVFADVVVEGWRQVDGIVDPRAREMVESFTRTTLRQTAGIMAGLQLTTGREMDSILAEDFPRPAAPRDNVWSRLLGQAA